MKQQKEILDNPKLTVIQSGADGGMGYVNVNGSLAKAPYVIWSFGGGWDHVSVSYRNRCPSWEEMCKIKDVFFRDDECCVEYHPAKKDYVNFCDTCLHIWRPQNETLPTPPKIYV